MFPFGGHLQAYNIVSLLICSCKAYVYLSCIVGPGKPTPYSWFVWLASINSQWTNSVAFADYSPQQANTIPWVNIDGELLFIHR